MGGTLGGGTLLVLMDTAAMDVWELALREKSAWSVLNHG